MSAARLVRGWLDAALCAPLWLPHDPCWTGAANEDKPCRTRIPASPSRTPIGSTTSISRRASSPNTSCSPATPIDRPHRAAPRQHRAPAPSPRVQLGHRDLQRPPRLGRLDRHRHGQRRDRAGRDPGDHQAADAHPHRLVRRAARRHRARRPRHHQRRRAPRGNHLATSSTTATRPSPTTRPWPRSSRRPARLGHRAHVGLTATAPGFYGAQGRPIPQLPIRYPDLAA